MKILRVRLKNLTSLRGEHKLDFYGSELGAHGLFAITGPTGAGKSTILDAICLALYNETPRLKRESFHYLSRLEVEGYAEVDFEAKGQQYTARWETSRKRKKIGGEAKSPEVRLSNAKGELLAEKINEHKAKIEEITGLDFDRFTKSILLAQGEFAAFLKASENQRAELLEAITGQTRYSEIGKRIFRTFQKYQEELEQLRAQLQGQPLLSPEEFFAKQTELEALKDQRIHLQTQQQKLQAAQHWQTQAHHLEQALAQAHQEQSMITEAMQQRQAQRLAFERAQQAEKLVEDFQALQALKKKHQELRQEQERHQAEKARVLLQEQTTRALWQTAEAELKTFQEEQEAQKPLLQAARLLDQTLELKHQERLKNQKDWQAILQQHQHLEEECAQLTENFQQAHLHVESLESWLKSHQAEGLLEKELSWLEGQGKQTLELQQQQHKLQTQIQQIESKLTQAETQFTKQQELCEKLHAQLETQQAEAQSLSAQEALLLQEGSEAQLQNAWETLTAHREAIQRLQRLQSQLQQTQIEVQTRLEKQTLWQKKLEALQAQLTTFDLSALEAREQELQELKDYAALRHKMAEERHQLKAGVACPLCGSPEHPLAGRSPAEEKAEWKARQKTYDQHKKQREALQNQYNQLSNEKKHWLQELPTLEQEIQTWLQTKEDQKALMQAELKALELSPEVDLIQALAQTQAQTQHIKSQLQRWVDWRKAQTQIQEVLRLQEQQYAEQRLKLKDLEQQRLQLRETLLHQLQQVQDLKHTLQKIEREIRENLDFLPELFTSSWQIEHLEKTLIPEARQRVQRYQQQSQQSQIAQQSWHKLEKQRTECQTKLRELNTRQAQLEPYLEQLKQEEKALQAERTALLEGLNIADVEASLAKKHQSLTSALQESQNNWTKAQQDLQKIESLLNTLTGRWQQTQTALEEAQQRWQIKLEQSQFAHQEEFLAARWPASQLQSIQAEFEDIEERAHRLRIQLATLTQQSDEHQAQQPAGIEWESLATQMLEFQTQNNEISQQIGAFHLFLTEQAHLQAKSAEQRQALEQKRQLGEHWAALNELIGSAEGDKFRKIAQVYTLRHLLQLTNQHLDALSGRYHLLPLHTESLSFEVLDRHQADTKRPLGTLSGGEIFLVSLAMALALSDLSRGQVAVGSLFLDEGFGTLDAETLEIVLSCLDRLQASGRKVGIISHVVSLQERIPAKIEVLKQAGGKSLLRITGTG